jgi:hypothetical protein
VCDYIVRFCATPLIWICRQLGSSLEADVDLIVPGDMTESAPLWDLLQREGLCNIDLRRKDAVLTLCRAILEDLVHRFRCNPS